MDHVVKELQKFALTLKQRAEYYKQRRDRQRREHRGDRSIENEQGSVPCGKLTLLCE